MDARFEAQVAEMFQSPKSGKFESNSAQKSVTYSSVAFQSPKSGKFESNISNEEAKAKLEEFQSPRSGKFESNDEQATFVFGYWDVSIPQIGEI